MQNKKVIIGLIIALIVVVGAVIYFFFPKLTAKFSKVVDLDLGRPQVVKEELVIPQTEKITGAETRVVEKGNVEVALVPKSKSEEVVVAKAVLTAKGSYNLAKAEAAKWSAEAIPVFIKSLGAVTLDGKSSQWQLAFSSAAKKGKGYEIVIQGDQIVSKKEVESAAKGVAFPENMPDSGEFVKKLQERPAFSDATLSSFLLASTPESTDIKWWFSVSTSKGTVTFEVK